MFTIYENIMKSIDTNWNEVIEQNKEESDVFLKSYSL